jgi:DNA-directed RNA polymerase subunit RPC12/RpoP
MECHECGMTISELENQEEQCKHEMRCFKCGFPLLKEFRKRPQDNYWDDDPDVKERDLELAIEEVSKETKPYFIDSKGKIQKSLFTNSEKHKKRMAWGNCFATREEALKAKDMLEATFSIKTSLNAS